MSKINFVTYCMDNDTFQFSENYLGPFIQSLIDIYKDDFHLTLTHSNVKNEQLDKVKNKVKNLTLVESTKGHLKQNPLIPAHKIEESWTPTLDKLGEGERIVLIDCDTVIIKPIDRFFDFDFDLAYTFYKDHFAPYGTPSMMKTSKGRNRINTGVMLCKNSDPLKKFFQEYLRRVENFLDAGSPLGGEFLATDQDALMWMLSNGGLDWERPYLDLINLEWSAIYENDQAKTYKLKVKTFSCKELNEPESIGEPTEETHIIHYKGGWRDVIPKPNWNKPKGIRTKENSLPFYNIWLDKLNKWNS